jgi:hypothetical protein
LFRVVAVVAVAAVVVTLRITQLNAQAELVGPEDSLVVVVVVVVAGPDIKPYLAFVAMAARAELVVPDTESSTTGRQHDNQTHSRRPTPIRAR